MHSLCGLLSLVIETGESPIVACVVLQAALRGPVGSITGYLGNLNIPEPCVETVWVTTGLISESKS